jgi:hypothetical protein
MMDNGRVKLDKVKVYRYGLMVLDIKEIGKIIKQMERVNLSILMEIFIFRFMLL